MNLVSSYNYATLKHWGLYSHVPSFLMLRLMVVLMVYLKYHITIFLFNKLGFKQYVFVKSLSKKELNWIICSTVIQFSTNFHEILHIIFYSCGIFLKLFYQFQVFFILFETCLKTHAVPAAEGLMKSAADLGRYASSLYICMQLAVWNVSGHDGCNLANCKPACQLYCRAKANSSNCLLEK